MTADVGGAGVPRFDVVLRGYDRRQVDEHVARLQRVMSRMRADLEMARSQPIPVVPPQQGGFGGPGRLPAGPPRPGPRPRSGPSDQPDMIGSFTDRMQSILQAAEEEAAEIRNKARAAAHAEAGSVRAELADLVRQRDAARAEVARLRGQIGEASPPRAPGPPRDGLSEQGRSQAQAPGPGQQPGGRAGAPAPGPNRLPAGGPDRPRPASPKPRPSPGTPGDRPPANAPAVNSPSHRPGSPPPPASQHPGSQLPVSSQKAGSGQPGSGQQPGSQQQPGGVQPGSGQPSSPQQPGSQHPGSQQPGSPQKPGSGQPGSGQPESGQPRSGQPGSGQPGSGQPGSGQHPGSQQKADSAQPGSAQQGPPQQGSPSVPANPQGGPPGSVPTSPPAAPTAGSTKGGSNGTAQAPSSGGGSRGALFEPPNRVPESRPVDSHGAGASGPKVPASESGEPPTVKAAHRLPTGSYPAVTEQVSMRPLTEADPEPGALFRPAAPDPGRRNGGEAQVPPAPQAAPERPAGGSPDVQATVKVQAVRPAQASDATVVTPSPPGNEKKGVKPDDPSDPKGSNGSGAKPGEAERPTSATRTG